MSCVLLHDLLVIEINWCGPMVVHSKIKWRKFSRASIQKRKKASEEYSYRVRIRVEGAPLITETFPSQKEALTFSRRMKADN